MRGRFITFEGGEGGGKSTQIERLSVRLRGCGVQVVTTREPGGTPMGEKIRALLVTGEPDAMVGECELLLMSAARAQHLSQVIRPALAAGKWVLCDRFADSTVSYQSFGRGLARQRVAAVNEWVLAGTRPDLTVLLDMDPLLGLARSRRPGNRELRFEAAGEMFHGRVREGFLAIAREEPGRVAVIDAAAAVEVVAEAVWRAVEERLGPIA